MLKPADEKNRKIVPRWRSVAKTPASELQNHRKQNPIERGVINELSNRVLEWQSLRTDDAATELLWATKVFGPNNKTNGALEEIGADQDRSVAIRNEARRLMNEQAVFPSQLSLHFEGTRETLHSRLKDLKQIQRISPNPILFIEFARIYSRLGQLPNAKKAIERACASAPTSRFVLRAAARFYVHTNELAKALHVLAQGNPNDPWIQASRISVADLANTKIGSIKHARALLDLDTDPKHLSELAGSLATLEYNSGNVSKAKKLFRIGSVDPNDNVVAQLHWASKNRILEFAPEMLDRSLTFEARTLFASREKKWSEAVRHAEEWLMDEPFSTRPAVEGSYIAISLLQDAHKAIEFCEVGLVANPDDFSLLNNLAYAFGITGDLEQARAFAQKAELHTKGPADRITSRATRGAILFAAGNHQDGAQEYHTAIEEALALKNRELAQHATVHYFTQCAKGGNFLSVQEAEEIRTLMEGKGIAPSVRDIYEMTLKPILPREIKFRGSDFPITPLLEKLVSPLE
jgi:tetratricopeptide (TPR) repeat protein